MKKLIFILLIMVVVLPAAFAETRDDFFFAPVSPRIMGQGNSFTAVADGYESLFTNPAGFARSGGSFTLLSATGSPYIPLEKMEDFTGFMGDVSNLDPENDSMSDILSPIDSLLRENGIGGNASAGMGFVGKNIGLGVILDSDLYGRARRDTLLSTRMKGHATVGGVAGLAFPFHFGDTTLYAGGDLRYMYRMRSRDLTMKDVLEMSAADSGGTQEEPEVELLVGDTFAMDLGLIAERGPFTLGLSVRDFLGTEFSYEIATANDMETRSELTENDPEYIIPMSVNLGASYRPDLGGLSRIIDPMFHAEYKHVFYQDSVYERNEGYKSTPSFWNHVHMGTEVKLLNFLKLRAGLNQGYPTVGAGLKLLFLDMNMSFFSREVGDYPGDEQNSGFTLEAALRF
ncbi:MAG: hypothetical protein R6V67_01980 [Spirochaetia bacterium]